MIGFNFASATAQVRLSGNTKMLLVQWATQKLDSAEIEDAILHQAQKLTKGGPIDVLRMQFRLPQTVYRRTSIDDSCRVACAHVKPWADDLSTILGVTVESWVQVGQWS